MGPRWGHRTRCKRASGRRRGQTEAPCPISDGPTASKRCAAARDARCAAAGPTRRRTGCGCSKAPGRTATSAGTRSVPATPTSIWKGRHVAEPTELSPDEAAGFWSDVARVAKAVDEQYRPAKMNWLSLGNGVPHLHVHLVPRPHARPTSRAPARDGGFPRRQHARHGTGAVGRGGRRVAGPPARVTIVGAAGRGAHGRGLRVRRRARPQARSTRLERALRVRERVCSPVWPTRDCPSPVPHGTVNVDGRVASSSTGSTAPRSWRCSPPPAAGRRGARRAVRRVAGRDQSR